MRRLVVAAVSVVLLSLRHARCLTRVRQVPRTCLAPALAVLVMLVLAACGGDNGPSVEQQEWIAELEIPLIQELDEPDFYGQVGLSPNGRNGTRIVIRLDEPFKSPLEAFIRRGCGGFRSALAFPDFDLGLVKDGKLDTEVDVPMYELRRSRYVIVVREPISEEQLRKTSVRDVIYEKGVCGDISSADRVDEL
jgi:hypothetical protein